MAAPTKSQLSTHDRLSGTHTISGPIRFGGVRTFEAIQGGTGLR
jgi:hypothetical protein